MFALLCITISTLAYAAPPVIYNTIPAPLPGNLISVPFQAGHLREFGDLIQFAGTNRALGNVTLIMSDFAKASDWPAYPGAMGPSWSHPITLNLYNVDNSGPNPAPGTLIATRTQTFAIPWRPADDVTCAPGLWRAPDGNCYGGIAFPITWDFTGTTVPNQIIYGIVYNTETFGPMPIGTPGPYISLNVALDSVPPTIGTNPFPDTAYLNGNNTAAYNDGMPPIDVFRRDTAWTPYSGAIAFEGTDSDVAITKTVTSPPPYATGLPITYTITLSNAGPSQATGVTVTDTIPAGTTFVSATPSQGTCSGTATVTCSIGTIASGGSSTITLKVNLPPTPGSVSNTATVTSTSPDSNPANNSSTATVTAGLASAIPTLSSYALLLLAFAFTLTAWRLLRP